MIVDNTKNILIVGLGLMGGSYAEGLKRYDFHISAITRSEESIEYALEKGFIDEGSTVVNKEMVEKADIIIFALYPNKFKKWIKDYQSYFKSGALLTDVTGVKTCVVYDIQNILREDVEYIAAHPMAGREVTGIKNADCNIFKNANYIVTPTSKNTLEAIETCKEIGMLLGFKNIMELSPEKHDSIIGFVSQLTHCIAISLMTCNEEEYLEKYTGDSFRDLTRIARINDEMWSELFIDNKEELINQMDMFMNEFIKLKEMIKNEDTENMRKMMKKSTQRRALFDTKR